MNIQTHGRGGYANGCRCGVCAEGQRNYMREYYRRKRGFYDTPRSRQCEHCGCAFDLPEHGSAARKRFCSKRCQNAALRPKPLSRVRLKAQRVAAKAARGTSSTWVWISGTCAECGDVFTRHGEASPYCSKACSIRERHRARRARQHGMKVTKVRRFRIHERDDWTCHICGDLVNRDARVPELDAPTLDHVVALAAGGAHDEANLKTAHFYCNSVKRDLPLADVA